MSYFELKISINPEIEEIVSERLFTASEIIEIEPETIPTKVLNPTSARFKTMPTIETFITSLMRSIIATT